MSTHTQAPVQEGASAERKQAGIISISLSTADGRRYTQIEGCR